MKILKIYNLHIKQKILSILINKINQLYIIVMHYQHILIIFIVLLLKMIKHLFGEVLIVWYNYDQENL